jgi:hypothetical protein
MPPTSSLASRPGHCSSPIEVVDSRVIAQASTCFTSSPSVVRTTIVATAELVVLQLVSITFLFIINHN